jgi:hypothetical protein
MRFRKSTEDAFKFTTFKEVLKPSISSGITITIPQDSRRSFKPSTMCRPSLEPSELKINHPNMKLRSEISLASS